MRALSIALAAALLICGTAGAAEFAVTAPADATDADVGDGTCATAQGGCTLRAAVQEANAAGGASTIVLPAGRYVLSVPPVPQAGSASDMDPANGDLDLEADITIRGAGPARTTVDGGKVDRVFETGADVEAAITDLTVTGGDSTANNSQEIDLGGGILNKSGMTLERVALVGNVSDGGGGMFSIPGTMPVIRDTLIAGNSAIEGGGLRIDHGATIVNTTIVGNTLRAPGELTGKPVGIVVPAIDEIAGYGGGIDHRGGADLTIVNSTIFGNHALKGGGGIGAGQGYAPASQDLPVGKLMLRNTIVAGNTSDAGPRDCRTNQVEFVSRGHNLDTDGSCFLAAEGDHRKTDPRLRPLHANGGPTQTLALRRDSPAIDAGGADECPGADQRGVPRPQGAACDIGAFERKPCRLVVRLPAALLARARSYTARVGGRVVRRKPSGHVRVARRAGVRLRVRLRNGRTVGRTVRPRCATLAG